MGKLTGLGYKLKIKLLKEGKSQTWLAKKLDISKQLLNNCIYGESNLKLEETLEHYIELGIIIKKEDTKWK